MIPVDDVQKYLTTVFGTERDYDTVSSVLDAETAAQAHRCIIPDGYPPDLREALMRRVAVSLNLRALTAGIDASVSAAGAGFSRAGGLDAEVQRLEAPYRRMVVG